MYSESLGSARTAVFFGAKARLLSDQMHELDEASLQAGPTAAVSLRRRMAGVAKELGDARAAALSAPCTTLADVAAVAAVACETLGIALDSENTLEDVDCLLQTARAAFARISLASARVGERPASSLLHVDEILLMERYAADRRD